MSLLYLLFGVKSQLRPTQTNAWDYHSYGMILYKLGAHDEAVKNLQLSLKMAKESKNEYLIQEVGKVLEKLKE